VSIVSPVPHDLQNGQTADATQVMADLNSIVDDVNDNAAHNGANNDITALLALTTPISYLLGGSSVFIGGTVTGTANAVALASPTPNNAWALTKGFIVHWLPTASNTLAMTLAVAGTAAKNVYKLTPAGVVITSGGEVVSGAYAIAVYDGTQYVLINPVVQSSSNLVNTGTIDVTGAATLEAATTLSGVISPTALAGNTNDWAPTSFSTAYAVRASASSAVNLTGLAGGAAGRRIVMLNVGSNNITLTSNDAASSAANRFLFSRPMALRPNESIPLWYDTTSAGWRTELNLVPQPVGGDFAALKVQTTSDTVCVVTADSLILRDANGETVNAISVSTSIASGTSGANGIDTGAIAASTWYAVWTIYNPTTNTVAGLISLSTTAPTMPSGYTFKARQGMVRTDGSSHFLRTLQYGRDAQYVIGTNPTVTPNIGNGTTGTYNTASPTLSAVSVVNFVPTAVASKIWVGVTQKYAAAGSPGSVTVAPSTAWGGSQNGPAGSNNQNYALSLDSGGSSNVTNNNLSVWLTLEATTIAWAGSGTGAGISCLGWQDNL
jgi:hypothetical protein